MFHISITAGSPTELAEAIRALSPIAFPTEAGPTVLTIEAEPAPAKVIEPEPAEPKQRRTRAKKDDPASNAEVASAASTVGNDEKADGVQLDIEDAISAKADAPAEQDAAPAEAKAAAESFTMTRAELKDWLIRGYLVDCIPEQNDRPAAFKALCEENGFKNFTETPDDKLPALKALADEKIRQFKNGGK